MTGACTVSEDDLHTLLHNLTLASCYFEGTVILVEVPKTTVSQVPPCKSIHIITLC